MTLFFIMFAVVVVGYLHYEVVWRSHATWKHVLLAALVSVLLIGQLVRDIHNTPPKPRTTATDCTKQTSWASGTGSQSKLLRSHS